MYRSALRATPRAAHALRPTAIRAVPRRFASTSPADKKRSWKSWAARLALAAGAVYWYNTSPAFAEELQPSHVAPPPQFSDEDLPTIEAVVERKRREAEARLAKAAAEKPQEEEAAVEAPAAQDGEGAAVGGPEELEAEAGQQGAFNPETGEINWDCPCLGGMAHGPCGEEFKAAFSCFVYSKEEPKGMDCIDKFQHMQDCFRQHPEVYGDELADDEGEAPAEAVPEAADAQAVPAEGATAPSTTAPVADSNVDVKPTTPTTATTATTAPAADSTVDVKPTTPTTATTAPATDSTVDVKPTAASETLPVSSAEVAKPQSKDA